MYLIRIVLILETWLRKFYHRNNRHCHTIKFAVNRFCLCSFCLKKETLLPWNDFWFIFKHLQSEQSLHINSYRIWQLKRYTLHTHTHTQNIHTIFLIIIIKTQFSRIYQTRHTSRLSLFVTVSGCLYCYARGLFNDKFWMIFQWLWDFDRMNLVWKSSKRSSSK